MLFNEPGYDICDCSCHDPGHHVLHIMACCSTCPHCHRRIKFSSQKHMEKCALEKAELIKRLANPTQD